MLFVDHKNQKVGMRQKVTSCPTSSCSGTVVKNCKDKPHRGTFKHCVYSARRAYLWVFLGELEQLCYSQPMPPFQ